MELKAYIRDNIGMEFRNKAMHRFGYFRGSLSNAVEEAIIQWLRKNDEIDTQIDDILKNAKTDANVIAIILFGSFARKDPSYRDVDMAFLLKDKNKLNL